MAKTGKKQKMQSGQLFILTKTGLHPFVDGKSDHLARNIVFGQGSYLQKASCTSPTGTRCKSSSTWMNPQ